MATVNKFAPFIWPFVVLVVAISALYLKPWQTKPEQTISVTAQGTAQVTPNIAKITANITSQNPNLDQARAQNEQKVAKIVEKLKSLGVEDKDIKTENISGSQGYEPQTLIYPPSHPTNDTFSQTLEITVRNFELTDEITSSLTQNGVVNLYGPNLTADDQKLNEAKSAARQNAVEVARQKAEELVRLSARKLGKVVNIQEQGDFELPVPLMLQDEAQLKQRATQIQPGQNNVTVNLQVEYQLK